ncbi:MAG: ACR3 family arsenite efflux transporter [Burkholderiales bacterium]|nr:ACR3 family arsenite efflux transporter [Burkholderiales bacterium]
MGAFERLLTLWVGCAMAVGVALGTAAPEFFTAVAGVEYAHVNLIVAALIWLMIYPMMIQIDWSAVKQVRRQPRGLALTLLINWLIKPFTMAALAVLFFDYLFAPWVDPQSADEYIAGMILLGVAPCTAMVFVWSQLVRGDPAYTLVQVAVNDVIMIFAFAPIAALLLGVTDIVVPWATLLLSTLLYVALPLIAGIVTRHMLEQRSPVSISEFVTRLKPGAMAGLLGTVLLLFGFQAQTLIDRPVIIAMIALPLVLQTYGIFFLGWWLARRLQLPAAIAGPACLIGTSNFFELAVAVAISLFGMSSGAALATVVGVLVEVPVMLSLVAMINTRRPASA